MGTGKTCATVSIIEKIFLRNGPISTVILCPLSTLFHWESEIKKYTYLGERDIQVIHGPASQRIKKLEEAVTNEMPIIILNYEALRTKDVFNLVKFLDPQVLVCDESHLLKNHKSIRSRQVENIATGAVFKYILTGTPILNSPMDLFQQFKILDGGKTFGHNFYTFRGKYFYNENLGKSWLKFPQFLPRTEEFPAMTKLIDKKASRVLKKDCLDLPSLTVKTIVLEMSAEQRRAYKQMKQNVLSFIDERGDEHVATATIILTQMLKLMQITSGFIKTDGGEEVEIKNNGKIEWIRDNIPTLVANKHKVIIWCTFKQDMALLTSTMRRLQIDYSFIAGGQNSSKREEERVKFCHGDTPVMIANRVAGGTGINLIESDYSVVYSRNYSLADELQSEARNHRSGSQMHDRITKVELVMKDTIEEEVAAALRAKQELGAKIIDVLKESR
jgi:SNF2 family DNA or RNA helicase